MNKPSSLKEKREIEDVQEFIHQRWLYVHELKAMLDEFPDDAYITLNQVGNLNVHKSDGSWCTIDLLWAKIERWDEDGEDD